MIFHVLSVSNLFNYFSVSGDSKQIKNFLQKKWNLTTARTPPLSAPKTIFGSLKFLWGLMTNRPIRLFFIQRLLGVYFWKKLRLS